MTNVKANIKGMNVFEHDYDNWRNHEECNGLISYGVAYKFWRWLNAHDLNLYEENIDDTYNNLSGARDGNRFDIHENYKFEDNLEISFLYVVNGNLWATIYDKANDSWFGDIEIENV